MDSYHKKFMSRLARNSHKKSGHNLWILRLESSSSKPFDPFRPLVKLCESRHKTGKTVKLKIAGINSTWACYWKNYSLALCGSNGRTTPSLPRPSLRANTLWIFVSSCSLMTTPKLIWINFHFQPVVHAFPDPGIGKRTRSDGPRRDDRIDPLATHISYIFFPYKARGARSVDSLLTYIRFLNFKSTFLDVFLVFKILTKDKSELLSLSSAVEIRVNRKKMEE